VKNPQECENHKPCAGILEQSMGVRNRAGIGLSYQLGMTALVAETLRPMTVFLNF
jgi:hypothetical protein